MASLIDQLRKRNRLQTEAAEAQRQQEVFSNAFQGSGNTVGGQSYGGIPSPVEIDYGSILGRAGSAFMAARKGKEASEKSSEAEAMNMEFMQSVLGSDEQAQKLFMAAQAGLPGADKALAEHIAPKKQSMAVLMQAITTGRMDPEMAAQAAPQFGIDPEVARKAAGYALTQMTEAEDRRFGRQQSLQNQRISAMDARQQAAIAARAPRSGARVSTGDGMSEPNDTTAGEGVGIAGQGLSPGQTQLLGKEVTRLTNELQKSTMSTGKYQNLRGRLEKSTAFSPGQKASKILSEFDNPILHGIGVATRNKDVADLEDFVLNETLSRMAQLGGNDSNEELRRMQASLPSALNSKEVALHLMDELNKWQEVTRLATKMRIADAKSGRAFAPGSEEDYYEAAKQQLGWTGWQEISAQPTVQEMGGQAPAQPKKPNQSIDDWLDQQGY